MDRSRSDTRHDSMGMKRIRDLVVHTLNNEYLTSFGYHQWGFKANAWNTAWGMWPQG